MEAVKNYMVLRRNVEVFAEVYGDQVQVAVPRPRSACDVLAFRDYPGSLVIPLFRKMKYILYHQELAWISLMLSMSTQRLIPILH